MHSLWSLLGPKPELPLPVAGTGAILLMGALILILGGILGELVYKLGDVREKDFSRLTVKIWRTDGRLQRPLENSHG